MIFPNIFDLFAAYPVFRDAVVLVLMSFALARAILALGTAFLLPAPYAYKMTINDRMVARINRASFVYALFVSYLAWSVWAGFPSSACVAFESRCSAFWIDIFAQVGFVLTILTLMDWNYSDLVNNAKYENDPERRLSYLRTLYANRGLVWLDLVFVLPLLALKFVATPLALDLLAGIVAAVA